MTDNRTTENRMKRGWSAKTASTMEGLVDGGRDGQKTELLREKLTERGVKWWPMRNNGYYKDRDTEFVVNGKKHTAHEWGDGLAVYNLTPEQAIAATLGWVDEPDNFRNELADGGLIADALAPVCVDEKERRAFERGRVHERFAQQIFKEATS